MIPKTIHYCWFGPKEKPKDFLRLLETWRNHNPDYKIIEWNETNFDVNMCVYSREAYLTANYAHVSDVCRIHVLLTHGGVYLDTDVEVLSSFDSFLKHESFVCEEHDGIGTGVIGAVKDAKWLNLFMEYYKSRHFINMWGHPNRTPNTQILTSIILPQLSTHERPTLFPTEYFCAKDWFSGKVSVTDNTVCIHHYVASWKRRKTLCQRISIIISGLRIRYFQ